MIEPADNGMMLVTPPRGSVAAERERLGGRKTKDDRSMLLPATSLNMLRLVEAYGEDDVLDDAPDEYWALATQPWGFTGFTDDERERAEAHRSWSTLKSFQQEAVEYLFCNPHAAALLGLSPGLGKSAATIVTADLLEAKRILVLAPVSLTFNWEREFRLWSDDDTRTFTRAVAGDRAPGEGVTIANHEVLQEVVVRDEDGNVGTEFIIPHPDMPDEDLVVQATNARRVREWIDAGPKVVNTKGKMVAKRERIIRIRRDYLKHDWDLIVIDESILLKNRKAKKTDVLATLRRETDATIISLSGSPVAKHRDDLFRQLQIMAPRAFSSYWRFAEFFCVVEKGQWGWTILGDRPEIDVKHYLRDYVFIRSQDEVLPDLPDYLVRNIDLEPTKKQGKALATMFEDWIAILEEAPDDPVLASNWLSRLTRLQQITSNLGALPKDSGGFHARSSAKEDLLIDLMKNDDIELPMLVWTWYVETTNSIVDRLSKIKDLRVGKVTGAQKRDDKIATIEAYRNGDLDVLVLQMGVGKFGHTFTDTRTIFYHDRSFDSDAWVQSLRRVRRIGLEHVPTLIVPRLVGSADQLVDENLSGKMRSIADMTNSDLESLLLTAMTSP